MKKWKWIFTAPLLAVFLMIGGIAARVAEIPGSIFLTNGSTRVLEFKLPFAARIEADTANVVKLSGTSLKDVDTYDMNDPIVVKTENSGKTSVSVNIFGLIPIKDIDITVAEEILLYPGGQSIGIMLYTQGALVVGSGAVETADGRSINPAAIAGLEAGDVICRANGIAVENASQLREIVGNAQEHRLVLAVERGEELREVVIEAVENKDGEHNLGIWVRDSMAGVGTLTFYEPNSGMIAGLGHAIMDADTGSMLRVKNGEIILSRVTEVIKGQEGQPGELKGLFDPKEEVIGYISENTEFGVYGESTQAVENGICGAIPAASRDEVREGPATVYCSVDDGGVREYSCEIEQITRHASAKSLVVRITDERLLERTGGIVQGMSGSPILQDGKLVGAVTHVLVNDPTRGYGIFIENMLDAAG